MYCARILRYTAVSKLFHPPPSEHASPFSVVKDYCSTLNHVFAVKTISTSKELSLLMRSFKKSFSLWEILPPTWNITFLLWSSLRVLYKHLHLALNGDLTLKMFFLLVLSLSEACKWISQFLVLGLAFRVVEIVYPYFVPEFVSKTLNPTIPDSGSRCSSFQCMQGWNDAVLGKICDCIRRMR